MRIDLPTVRTGDAAFAAGIAHATLLGWLDRSLFALTEIDQDTPGSGVPRLFTLRRVYQLALTAELAGLRIPVRIGAAIASRFSDAGSEGRGPGELFADGPTNLISGWPAVASTDVTNSAPQPLPFSFVAVDCRRLVAEVNGRLVERGIIIPPKPRLVDQCVDCSLTSEPPWPNPNPPPTARPR